MSENVQIVLGIIFLIGIYILTRILIIRKMNRIAKFIIEDLKRRNALDEQSSVILPYAKPKAFNIGMRDYKPKTLESLIQNGVIGKVGNDKYYLKVSETNILEKGGL